MRNFLLLFVIFFLNEKMIFSAEIEKKCKNLVKVVTIDTGVDLQNEKIRSHLIRGPSGFLGKNVLYNGAPIQDFNGHGTQMADIITNVSNCAQIIPVSYWEDSASLKINPFISALEEAINYNPKIINISGGGNSFYEREYLAIKKAESLGIIIVSAAGNDGKNIDIPNNKYFPASYGASNIITVNAVDKNGELGKFSNYGSYTVDISAIGIDVASFGLYNEKLISSGTSQATAYVSGVIKSIINKSKSRPYTNKKYSISNRR